MRRTKWTAAELTRLAYQHSVKGNKWAVLAKIFHKTDAQVKNIFHSFERSKSGFKKSAVLFLYTRCLRDRACADDPEARRAALKQARHDAHNVTAPPPHDKARPSSGPPAGPSGCGRPVSSIVLAQQSGHTVAQSTSRASSDPSDSDGGNDEGKTTCAPEGLSPGRPCGDGTATSVEIRKADEADGRASDPNGVLQALCSGGELSSQTPQGAPWQGRTVVCDEPPAAVQYSPSRDPLLLLRERNRQQSAGAPTVFRASDPGPRYQPNDDCSSKQDFADFAEQAAPLRAHRPAGSALGNAISAGLLGPDICDLDDTSPFIAVTKHQDAAFNMGSSDSTAPWWRSKGVASSLLDRGVGLLSRALCTGPVPPAPQHPDSTMGGPFAAAAATCHTKTDQDTDHWASLLADLVQEGGPARADGGPVVANGSATTYASRHSFEQACASELSGSSSAPLGSELHNCAAINALQSRNSAPSRPANPSMPPRGYRTFPPAVPTDATAALPPQPRPAYPNGSSTQDVAGAGCVVDPLASNGACWCPAGGGLAPHGDHLAAANKLHALGPDPDRLWSPHVSTAPGWSQQWQSPNALHPRGAHGCGHDGCPRAAPLGAIAGGEPSAPEAMALGSFALGYVPQASQSAPQPPCHLQPLPSGGPGVYAAPSYPWQWQPRPLDQHDSLAWQV